MPVAKLPTTFKGWVVAAVSSFVGFITGYWALKWMSDKWR